MISVSVITPVYNVPLEYLRTCLNSLAIQSLQNCEFIVVLDGASEKECSICEEYATKDSRFRIFNREHTGVSATKNFALSKANGEYVTFVDADDWVECDFLNEVFEIASKMKLDILNWDYQYGNTPQKDQVMPLMNHSVLLMDNSPKKQFLDSILINQHFGQSLSACWTRLYKTSFLKEQKISFCNELTIGEDKAFNYQAYAAAIRIGYINKTFYNYRIRNDSTIHKYIPNSLSIYLKYIKHIDSFCLPENKKSLGKEFLNIFFYSLNNSYFPSNRFVSTKSSIKNLKEIISSDAFQQSLHLVKGVKLPFNVSLYLSCLRMRIFFPIYLRAIRHLFQRIFICSSKQ